MDNKRLLTLLKEYEKGLTMQRAALIAIIRMMERDAGIQSSYPAPRIENETIAGYAPDIKVKE